MPLSNFLKFATGTCRYCGNKAEILARDHPGCRRAHQTGWNEMLGLAAGADRTHKFDETTLPFSIGTTGCTNAKPRLL